MHNSQDLSSKLHNQKPSNVSQGSIRNSGTGQRVAETKKNFEASKYINIHQVQKLAHESTSSVKLNSGGRFSNSSSKHHLQKKYTTESSREKLSTKNIHLESSGSLQKPNQFINFNQQITFIDPNALNNLNLTANSALNSALHLTANLVGSQERQVVPTK